MSVILSEGIIKNIKTLQLTASLYNLLESVSGMFGIIIVFSRFGFFKIKYNSINAIT